MNESHKRLSGTHRTLPVGARRIRDVNPNSHVAVTIVLKAPPLPPPNKMPAKALSPADFVKKYGAASATIAKVEKALRGYSLQVEGVGPLGRTLHVSGTAAAMQATFHAGLGVYENDAQGEFRAREGDLSAPAEVADLITAVLGLDQRQVATRKATSAGHTKSAAQKPPKKPATAHGPDPATPAEIEILYSFPPGDCTDQKIAIAEFGSPPVSGTVFAPAYFPEDLTKFCKEHHRPEPIVNTIPVNIAPLTASGLQVLPASAVHEVLYATTEVMMDVQIIAGLCSGATISVYYASFDQKGWVDLLERVCADQPVVLSASYALAEDSPNWEHAAVLAINEVLQAAAMLGITVCVAAGDDGSNCHMSDDRAHVEFPASSPFVLSVGGTMVSGEEVVWWQWPGRRTPKGAGATGGGVSVIFHRPPWQTTRIPSLNTPSIEGRTVPDVAALAGPPGYSMIMQGNSATANGTSAATPVWASLLARINAALPPARQQRFIPPLLYQNNVGTRAFVTITKGNNASHPKPGKGYSASQTFDAVTGWGVPDGKKLLAALGSRP